MLLFRQSMMRDLERAQCLVGARLLYSLGEGYLKAPRMKPLLEWLTPDLGQRHNLALKSRLPMCRAFACERSIIRERSNAWLTRAEGNGQRLGRP